VVISHTNTCVSSVACCHCTAVAAATLALYKKQCCLAGKEIRSAIVKKEKKGTKQKDSNLELCSAALHHSVVLETARCM
jgi:hypothetical protein